MLKNVQFNKIILGLFLIGMIIISGLGVFFLISLQNLNGQLSSRTKYCDTRNTE